MSDERTSMNQQEISWEGFPNQRVEPFPFKSLIITCCLPFVMALFSDNSLWHLVVALVLNFVVSYYNNEGFMQNNEGSQQGNQIISRVAAVKNKFISMVGYFIYMVAAVKNKFISMVGDHDYQTRSTYSSIRKISLWKIMLIWVIVVFTFGIAVKLWIKDILTSFMCLNITVSLINLPMVAKLLFPPMMRGPDSGDVLKWLTSFLVNLLAFTVAPSFAVWPGIYQLYDEYNTRESIRQLYNQYNTRETLQSYVSESYITEEASEEASESYITEEASESYTEEASESYITEEASESYITAETSDTIGDIRADISFEVQHQNILVPDDHVSEPSNEFSNLEKMYDLYNTSEAPKANEDIPNSVISHDRSFVVQQENILKADDHVFESPKKFSDLEKMYGDENFRRCFGLLAYLFPIDYEYEKNDIIQLWMADGFTQPSVETNKLLEDAANVYFDAFAAAFIFQSSHSDGNSRPRYKLNHSIFHDLHKPPIYEYCRIESGKQVSLSENTRYTSFICDSSVPVDFKALYQSKKLSTLLLVHAQRYSSINRVPYDLFLELPLLRALDLSGTNITELPSSVGNLKQMRLLNLSKTLVRKLPDSLCSLYLMQTMILRDCSKLVGLPKGMRKLIKLRHLDLDIASLLISMPPGIGDLIELQTLSAFIVGKDDGSHITELKHMANLQGSLGIMMLENISNAEEAKEAALDKKKYLERLELQWTELQDGVDEVLQHLQPHENLKELQIVGYGGAQFPGWIGNPYFSKLETVTLHNCSKCEVLPSLGKLPLLGRLQISEMHSVKTIDAQFCGREIGTPHLDLVLETVRPQAGPFNGFLRLNNLRISRMPALEKWCGMEEGDFSLLRKLSLSRFAKLTALPELSVLKALQELEISLCPVLQFLPKKSLPTSLQSLLIISCPLLKEQCRKEGQEWGEIAHIPSIWIDNQQIL